jgi:vanillate monooxygenase
MFLMNYWYVAGFSDEIGATPVARILCGIPMVLYRTESGAPAALRDLCPHRRAPLSKGRVVGDLIECGYHGLSFDTAGACVKIPGQASIPPQACVDSFPVIDRWGWLWVWTGAPAAADPTTIPDKPWLAEPGWHTDRYYYHVKAGHQLMSDNLLDLGHVAYIHADTIGFDAGQLESDPLVTEIVGTTVRNTRRFVGIKPAPAVKAWGDFAGAVDRVSISDWTPPGFTAIQFTIEDATTRLVNRVDHLITPETDSTHHYWIFFSRNYRTDDPELTERMYRDNDKVAGQDLDMVEAQQRAIAASPGSRDLPIRQDRGLEAAHRILTRLMAEERGGRSAA